MRIWCQRVSSVPYSEESILECKGVLLLGYPTINTDYDLPGSIEFDNAQAIIVFVNKFQEFYVGSDFSDLRNSAFGNFLSCWLWRRRAIPFRIIFTVSYQRVRAFLSSSTDSGFGLCRERIHVWE